MTAIDSLQRIQGNFAAALQGLTVGAPRAQEEAIRADTTLDLAASLAIFRAQAGSRQLDYVARTLKNEGRGYYTIASAGHEGNAAVAAALRVDDPAFLHYRSGAFYLYRSAQAGRDDGLRDVLLGITAARDDVISGGRHKVFGHPALQIPPQTSTIASHLPKAVGAAIALDRSPRFGDARILPKDAIVVCSFGDASINHASAVGAINAACWATFQRYGVPLLLVCEDNGLGISVPTPRDWIATQYGDRPGLRYFAANGLDFVDCHREASRAIAYVRRTRSPALLHMRCVRLLGHAGSDLEQAYRAPEAIAETEARDPLIATVRILVEEGGLPVDKTEAIYHALGAAVQDQARRCADAPKLTSRKEVLRPLAPRSERAIDEQARQLPEPEHRRAFWDERLPEDEGPRTLAKLITFALGDLLLQYPQALIFGEDVAQKGGVYGVTMGLMKRAGRRRVFNTLLDEETILGLAIGSGMYGYLPMPEIQYLAYLHNAIDQIRGEAASLQFFSNGAYRNPMLLRIASFAYQKGFGGHFHNDNAVAALREIPGLVIAAPARGSDAVQMLRTCAAAAAIDGAVCVFLEPIALYHTRDLHAPGDQLWSDPYPLEAEPVPLGSARCYGEGGDLTIVSFANGVWMSLRVAQRLKDLHGITAQVVDLRWISPLPVDDVLTAALLTKNALIVDETRHSGSLSEGLIAGLVDRGFCGAIARVTSADSYIPLGDAANLVLVSEDDIEHAALRLLGRK